MQPNTTNNEKTPGNGMPTHLRKALDRRKAPDAASPKADASNEQDARERLIALIESANDYESIGEALQQIAVELLRKNLDHRLAAAARDLVNRRRQTLDKQLKAQQEKHVWESIELLTAREHDALEGIRADLAAKAEEAQSNGVVTEAADDDEVSS